MRKVVDEFPFGKYKMLILDGEVPFIRHNKYRIDGEYYDPVIVYDAKNCIAIISKDSFVGKTVYFEMV